MGGCTLLPLSAGHLIYWPPQGLANGSPDDIVDAALGYRPTAL